MDENRVSVALSRLHKNRVLLVFQGGDLGGIGFSTRALSVKQRFLEWFQRELKHLSESSKILVKKRELSFYGGEEAFLSPDEVIGKEDAKDAVERAGRAFTLCRKLVKELED
jgi:hypothetical protein